MRGFLILIFFLFSFSTVYSKDNIVGGLSEQKISINATFHGSKILVFGAIKRDTSVKPTQSDIVIEVIGPKQEIKLRKKKKLFGIWINGNLIEVGTIPSFYTIFQTRSIEVILNELEKARLGIGLQSIINPVAENVNFSETRQAIMRIKSNEGSYILNHKPLILNQETLFSAVINLPANLIEGDYETRIHLIQKKSIVASSTSKIQVRKIGLERFLFTYAHQKPLIYGIFSIFLALFSGWTASEIFRLIRR